jgi:hypothetical protein
MACPTDCCQKITYVTTESQILYNNAEAIGSNMLKEEIVYKEHCLGGLQGAKLY